MEALRRIGWVCCLDPELSECKIKFPGRAVIMVQGLAGMRVSATLILGLEKREVWEGRGDV